MTTKQNQCGIRSHFRPLRARTSVPFALGAAGAGIFLALSAVAHAEDVAICASVNHYPSLRSGADLSGCDNDAQMMADKLATLGFRHPVVLKDDEATKQGILDHIKALKSRLHPGDRAVFFFAGHGTISSSGDSVILPSDAEDGSEEHDIQVKDLYDVVKDLGDDVHKTVILDSCHSGGMIRGIAGLRGYHQLRARFYVRTKDRDRTVPGHRDIKRWQESGSDDSDDLKNVVHDDHPSEGGGICYFTAAQKNQVANEKDIDGETHGLFTYYLVRSLTQSGDLWRDVNAQVSDKLGKDTDDEQRPLLYPSSMLGKVVFGGSSTPKPQPFGLDGLYNLSHPDPGVVSLRRHLKDGDSENMPVEVGSKNYFEIKVGQDGYLVVIGRDPNQELDVLYPKQPTREAMEVHAGDIIRIPGAASHFMVPDAVGTDGVKAILFSSADKAQAMLSPFKQSGDRGYRSLGVRNAVRAWHEEGSDEADGATYFTSEVTTQIIAADGAGH